MKKRNLYILLAIICICSVVILGNLSDSAPPSTAKPDLASPDKISENIVFQNPIFVFITLIYAFIFFAGLINLGIFFIRKLSGKAMTAINYPKKKLPLNQETSAKLIFLISFLLLLTYLLPSFFFYFSNIAPIYIILLSNLLLQIGSVYLVLNYINPKFFGLTFRKKDFNFILKTYTAIIPILAVSIILNLFLLKILGIEPGPSPIIKLVPLLKTKFSLFLFIFQTIIVAPLAEELIFRGVFYELLRKKYSFLAAATGLSVFFALLHRSPAGTLGLFIISFSLCYVYEKTQKISTAFAFHALHNTITLLFFLGTKI